MAEYRQGMRWLTVTALAGALIWSGAGQAAAATVEPSTDTSAARPARLVDGTLVQRGFSDTVAMMLDGARIDFDDMADVKEAGCYTTRRVVLPAVLFDAIPQEPDRLYAALDHSVDVEAITPDPQYRSDCHPVYRADGRAPEVIFQEGFAAKDVADGQYDVQKYVLKNQPSPFVSTTYRDDLYKDWKPRFYYEVDAPGGIDVNMTIGDDHKYADQEEIAFPGGLDTRFVVKGCPVDRATLTIDESECQDNPNYEPWRKR